MEREVRVEGQVQQWLWCQITSGPPYAWHWAWWEKARFTQPPTGEIWTRCWRTSPIEKERQNEGWRSWRSAGRSNVSVEKLVLGRKHQDRRCTFQQRGMTFRGATMWGEKKCETPSSSTALMDRHMPEKKGHVEKPMVRFKNTTVFIRFL